MQQRIVDREAEARTLQELADRGSPKLALVYGRRRIGKTHLLSNLWERSRTFYFTASATTPEQNRRQLVREAGRWSGQALRPEDHPTWRLVFRMLLDLRAPRPLVVVIDEFQYLGDDPTDLGTVASELNAAWETPRPERPLLFILSGSSVRTLEALSGGGASLYGRFDWTAELSPFDYRDAGQMAPYEDLRDRARVFGIFGGVPHYLDAVDPARTVAENVADLMLAPRGEVRGQVETAILQEQGLREIPKYVAILRAIGAGRTKLNGIAGRAGLSHDTALRRKVERLVDLGYVDRQRNLGAARTAPFRYRLRDPAFRFYHEFVAPNETMLELEDPLDVWNTHLSSRLDGYMGHLFEFIVEQAYRRLRKDRDLPIVKEWGRWEGRDRNREPLEMEIAATLADGRVLTGSIKWNRTPLDARIHLDHLAMIERLANSGVKWAHEAREKRSPLLYAAAGGFSDDFRKMTEATGVQTALWELEDLYPPDCR